MSGNSNNKRKRKNGASTREVDAAQRPAKDAATTAAPSSPARPRSEPAGARRGMGGTPVVWIIGAAATFALFVVLAMNVDLVDQSMAFEQPHGPAAGPAHGDDGPATIAEQPPTTLETLSCFKCHALGRYHEGGDFSHDLHAEEHIGHCHMCHAFEGHFRVTVREATCEECH